MRVQKTNLAILFSVLALVQNSALADGGVDEKDTAGTGKVVSSTGTGASSGNGSGGGLGLERATGSKLSKAMGHYARARSLLIAAIQEFDKGYAIATPDAILDSKSWRGSVIDRTRELERVLDPQPRMSESGSRYDADSRLLKDPTK